MEGAWAATASWATSEPVGYEELAWRIDPDALEGVPKSHRRKITGTYCAAGRSGQLVLRPRNVRMYGQRPSAILRLLPAAPLVGYTAAW